VSRAKFSTVYNSARFHTHMVIKLKLEIYSNIPYVFTSRCWYTTWSWQICYPCKLLVRKLYGKGKGKVHPITGHEGPKVE